MHFINTFKTFFSEKVQQRWDIAIRDRAKKNKSDVQHGPNQIFQSLHCSNENDEVLHCHPWKQSDDWNWPNWHQYTFNSSSIRIHEITGRDKSFLLIVLCRKVFYGVALITVTNCFGKTHSFTPSLFIGFKLCDPFVRHRFANCPLSLSFLTNNMNSTSESSPFKSLPRFIWSLATT